VSDWLKALLDAKELVIGTILLGVGYFRGRRNEQRHLAELKQQERKLRDVLVFATRYPPASTVPLDPVMVTGSAAIASDYFQMFVAGLRKIVGGRFDAYEHLISRARRQAMIRLKEAAREAGCRTVFNLRLETTRITQGARGGFTAVEVFAYATGFRPATGSVAESVHQFRPGLPLSDSEMFDLARNPGTRRLLWVLGAATVYIFAEVFGFNEYQYVTDRPMGLIVPLGIGAALWATWGLRKKQVPIAETIVLGLLVAVIGAFSANFLLLRINAATDFSPQQETRYVLQSDLSLHDPRGQAPDLRFPHHHDYWSVQEKGSEHTFTLRRGWLGFWQFNESRYFDRLREHFQKRNRS
jgi:uncharacterized protein YbjQ (UPF0145 family)